MRNDQERLEDILEAIGRIMKYARQGRQVFEHNELVQTWIIHHLQIIGEAARKVSDTLREHHPELPWAQIIAMRNILVHDYFNADTEEVWAAVEHDLPDLKCKIEAILQEVKEASHSSTES